MYEEWFATVTKDPDMPTQEETDAFKDFVDGQTLGDIAAQRCTARINEEEEPDP